MPGTKRKPIAFSYDEIRNHLLSIGDKDMQFLFAVSYANGTRVSEVIGLRASDVEITDEFVYVKTPVLKKRRNDVFRAPPIYIKGEPWLANIIINYVANREGELISYSKRSIQRKFNEYFDCTSHSFRHTRATHCFTVLGMSERLIADYFRISPASLADWIMRYGHLIREDMQSHLKRNYEKKVDK